MLIMLMIIMGGWDGAMGGIITDFVCGWKGGGGG